MYQNFTESAKEVILPSSCANPSLAPVPFSGKDLSTSASFLAEAIEGGGNLGHLASAIGSAWIGMCILDTGE